MTAPTITWGHGWMFDCDTVTGWTTNSAGITGPAATSDGEVLTLTGAPNTAGDDYIIKYKDISASAISTVLYPKCLVRWKTSVAASGLQAKLVITYTAASGGGSTTTILGFSTKWTTTTITLTDARVIEQVQFIGDDNPDALTGGATYYSVYFDFCVVFAGTWTFPFVSNRVHLHIENLYAFLSIPSRVGNASQYLGQNSMLIGINGTMDTGTGWHGSTTLDGEYLYRIFYEAHSQWQPWVWLTTDLINCKALPLIFDVDQDDKSGAQRVYMLEFKMHNLTSGSATDWSTLQWYGF